jgi:hypothetical protein
MHYGPDFYGVVRKDNQSEPFIKRPLSQGALREAYYAQQDTAEDATLPRKVINEDRNNRS